MSKRNRTVVVQRSASGCSVAFWMLSFLICLVMGGCYLTGAGCVAVIDAASEAQESEESEESDSGDSVE